MACVPPRMVAGAARMVALGCAFALLARGQVRLDADDPATAPALEAFRAKLAVKSLASPLTCHVEKSRAALGYDFNLWTGFNLVMPARQFADGKEHVVTLMFRVTGAGGSGPVYFARRAAVPAVPDNLDVRKIEMLMGAGFLVGAGDYQVEMLAVDSAMRSCRSAWKLKARAPASVTLRLAPGVADDGSSLIDRRGPALVRDGRPATIFVNAFPVMRRRHMAQLSWFGQRLLLETLRSVVEAGRFGPARVVVFDLRRRKVIFESDSFERASYRRLLEALGRVDLGTIDYGTLAGGNTEWEFLKSLAGQEARRAELSRAIVYIGSGLQMWREKKSGALDGALRETLPKPFCLTLLPMPAPIPVDAVSEFVRSLRGRVLLVRTPADLASALRKLADDLNAQSP